MTRELLGVLIGGVTLGSSYAIMAIGMSLVYGVSKVFNFAYGSFFIWGAYFAWSSNRCFYCHFRCRALTPTRNISLCYIRSGSGPVSTFYASGYNGNP